MRSNSFMTFMFEASEFVPMSFGYVITQKAFDTFIGSNQPNEVRLVEEDVTFPWYLMRGDTRRALVHYVADTRFACYVPVEMTDAELKQYDESFGR